MNNMIERLETIARRYEELNEILMDPSIASDIQKMTEASKEQASLENAYRLYEEYKKVLSGIEEAKELMNEDDPEIKEMAELELSELEEKKPLIEEKLHLELRVSKSECEKVLDLLETEYPEFDVKQSEFVKLSIVGYAITQDNKVLNKIINILQKYKIEVLDINLTQSKIEIILVDIKNSILEELHKELIKN